MALIDDGVLIQAILNSPRIETETVPKLIRLIKAQPKVCGQVIEVDAFAEAIENLNWYSLHNGKMIQGAEGSDNAYYRASDIYTEINKAVTIRADVIEPSLAGAEMSLPEPKCADGCIYGWGSDECEKCRFKCEPKTGRWIEKTVKEGSPFFWRRFYCTACGDWTTHGKSKFCPNCGARMEGEQ